MQNINLFSSYIKFLFVEMKINILVSDGIYEFLYVIGKVMNTGFPQTK
jgi:hypothetical protein